MNETEMRFALLLREMESVQHGIRAMDTAMFAIKGWCVTIVTAVAGFALNKDRPLMLVLAIMATACFWLLDSYFKALQRIYIVRDLDLEEKLRRNSVTDLLSSNPPFVPELASRFLSGAGSSFWKNFGYEVGLTWTEARTPVMFSLYILLLISVGVVAVVLLVT